MYHVIECKGLKYKESKFNKIIVACLLINFVLVIPTFECLNYSFSTTELIIFITAEIILISTEIYRLIKDNGKKYEWPIYISFFFNTFAVIFIIISIFMY